MTYQNSCTSLVGEDFVHAGLDLFFHNNVNVTNHIQSVKDQRREQKNIMLEKIDKAQTLIDSMDVKEIVNTIQILNEKGIIDTIEFTENLKRI